MKLLSIRSIAPHQITINLRLQDGNLTDKVRNTTVTRVFLRVDPITGLTGPTSEVVQCHAVLVWVPGQVLTGLPECILTYPPIARLMKRGAGRKPVLSLVASASPKK